jgi:hypothetical protein
MPQRFDKKGKSLLQNNDNKKYQKVNLELTLEEVIDIYVPTLSETRSFEFTSKRRSCFPFQTKLKSKLKYN